MKSIIKLLPELLIVLLSFFIFSISFTSAVSSDDALTTLMTHQFHFPETIYCWEQNRGGSIVPLIAQLFYKVSHLSPVLSSDIARYLILILGFLSFRSFLNKKSSKIILAILYFLPPFIFIGFTKFSWGLMYSLIGMSLYVLSYCLKAKTLSHKTIGLAGFTLLIILATWTSDQAYLIFIYLGIVFILYHRKEKIKRQQYAIVSIFILLISAAGIYFIKEAAVITIDYGYHAQNLNNFNGIYSGLSEIAKGCYLTLSFQMGNIIYSIYSISLLFITLYSLWKWIKTGLSKKHKSILLGIGALSIGIIFMVISSHWALLNSFSRRYYSGFYFLFISAILYFWDKSKLQSRKINWILSLTLIIGFLSTPYHYLYDAPKTLIPRSVELSEFNQLDGSIGIIGDYWYSYGISYINPDKIIATPHDGAQIRNFEYTQKVFKQDHLYLIKNLWLDEFPDEIQQFGKKLKKTGEPFQISEVELQEYQLTE